MDTKKITLFLLFLIFCIAFFTTSYYKLGHQPIVPLINPSSSDITKQINLTHINPWDNFINHAVHKCAYPPLINPQSLSGNGLICIVVRSYSEHLKLEDYNIRRLLTCLEQMEYTHWKALFFSTDENSIDDIDMILKERNPIFHDKYIYLKDGPRKPYVKDEFGYNITDWAISKCPEESEWLLVTNGDNEYSPKTFSYLDGNIDACSFDFFTRNRWPPLTYRKVFQEDSQIFPNRQDDCYEKVGSCGRNALGVYTTDLGATIWRYPRWKAEKVTYSIYSPHCCHDGLLARDLEYAGWVVKKVPYCFFSHSPNPWTKCKHHF